MEFFLNRAGFLLNSANSGNLVNHWRMNRAQFMDPVSHMCLAGPVVASWSLTQEVAGSSPFTVMKNILSLNSANSVKKFRKNSNEYQLKGIIIGVWRTGIVKLPNGVQMNYNFFQFLKWCKIGYICLEYLTMILLWGEIRWWPI